MSPVDFLLSANRDVKVAKAFFRKALETQGRAPVSITLDGTPPLTARMECRAFGVISAALWRRHLATPKICTRALRRAVGWTPVSEASLGQTRDGVKQDVRPRCRPLRGDVLRFVV